MPGSDRKASWTRSTAPRSAGVGTSTTTWIGPLKPAAEAGGELVVGGALRRVRGGVAVVGRADAHAERRDGDRAQHAEAHDRVADRVAADVVGPAAGERLVAGLVDVALAVDRELVDLRAGEAEQPGEQRDRGGHRDGHDQRDRHAHRRDGREAGEEQAEDGDDDGACRRTAPPARRWRSRCRPRPRRSCRRGGAGGGG